MSKKDYSDERSLLGLFSSIGAVPLGIGSFLISRAIYTNDTKEVFSLACLGALTLLFQVFKYYSVNSRPSNPEVINDDDAYTIRWDNISLKNLKSKLSKK